MEKERKKINNHHMKVLGENLKNGALSYTCRGGYQVEASSNTMKKVK
jgi:hypothetical protein